jgi:7-alpha-hydroxysteroid dehydrogenase
MILDEFRLTDQVAIVTGSGHGIGRAIALAFADAGANVVCCSRTQADIDETARLVRERGRECLAQTCDVLETKQLEKLVEGTMTRFGRINVLVNNAGGAIPRPALKISERAFEKVVRFNLTSPFLLTRMVVPHIVKTAGTGAIVNVSSGASVMQLGGMAHYAAAKAGLNQLSRILAVEFAPRVRVNAIIVGQIDTPGASSVLSDELKVLAASKIPMKTLGRDTDIATCALYLASPAGGWVTGQTVTVNGGSDGPPLEFPLPSLEDLIKERDAQS